MTDLVQYLTVKILSWGEYIGVHAGFPELRGEF